jgi:hypothetical protein
MPKEKARKSNIVELNVGKRERIDKGFKEPKEMLAVRANAEPGFSKLRPPKETGCWRPQVQI